MPEKDTPFVVIMDQTAAHEANKLLAGFLFQVAFLPTPNTPQTYGTGIKLS
jgi:hypothetical protein